MNLVLKLLRLGDFLIGNCSNLAALLLQDRDQILLELHLGRIEEACLGRIAYP